MVELAALEKRYAARYPGFESPPLRQEKGSDSCLIFFLTLILYLFYGIIYQSYTGCSLIGLQHSILLKGIPVSNMSWARFLGEHTCPPQPDYVPDSLLHDFIAEILANPEWGLIRLIPWWRPQSKLTVQAVADMHRQVAAGKLPSPLHDRTAWDAISTASWRVAGVRSRGATMPWGRVAEECAAESTIQSTAWNRLFLILRRAAFHFKNKGGGQKFMEEALVYWYRLSREMGIESIPFQALEGLRPHA